MQFNWKLLYPNTPADECCENLGKQTLAPKSTTPANLKISRIKWMELFKQRKEKKREKMKSDVPSLEVFKARNISSCPITNFPCKMSVSMFIQAPFVCFVLMEDAADSGLYQQNSFHAGNCSINQPMLLTMEHSVASWDHLLKMRKMWKSETQLSLQHRLCLFPRTVCLIFCAIFTREVFWNWPRTQRLQEGPDKHPKVFAEASILDDPMECVNE
ncbi:hypothetical protein WISP_118795 [Willisornis vidua]|uniref:Uncharacterized protein n=1 Tax=Willisornis vidua TaxID=1566151 RepID=A0ABQ9CY48_9PASS|nr:hypothetical protein WISP_118795 [Willisornis vidua]